MIGRERLDLEGRSIAAWRDDSLVHALGPTELYFFLENEYDSSEEVLRLTPSELLEALEAWLAFLETS